MCRRPRVRRSPFPARSAGSNLTKVLVIEDERSQQAFVVSVLRQNGFETLGTDDGAEGIELAVEQLPDLIVCDIHLGVVDGFEMLSAIRKNPSTASIPFILMTALADREGMRHGMELGADDYLPKPFTGAELISAVNARLEKHRRLMKDAGKKLDELRISMSAMLPHELRTPLNGILGYADLMRKQSDDLQPAEIARMSERMYRNARRLQRLVENYLLYAQLELQQTAVHAEHLREESHAINVAEMLERTGRVKSEEFNRSSDLLVRLVDSSLAIAPGYFSKMAEEVLDNAFRYSKAGSPVKVESEVRDYGYVYSVTDQGRGMSPEQIAGIGAFVQFERKIYEQQGSGLGLTIVARLAKLHGGNLEVQSRPGNGTVVKITLPQA